MKIFLYGGAIILIIAIVSSISFGLWKVGKKINYSLGYKTMVEQTIKEMVKPEALKRGMHE